MQQHNLALNDKSHLLQICKRLSIFFVTNAGCCRRAVMRFFTIIFNACIIDMLIYDIISIWTLINVCCPLYCLFTVLGCKT